MGWSSPRRPASTCCSTATAVNALVTGRVLHDVGGVAVPGLAAVVARLGVGPPPFEVLTGCGPGDEPVLGGVQGRDELPAVVGDLRLGQGQLGPQLVGDLRVAVGVPG